MKSIDPDRDRCLAPFCRRTFKRRSDESSETMCGAHWRTIPKWRRSRYSRLVRAFRRLWQTKHHAKAERILVIVNKEWARLARFVTAKAIEHGPPQRARPRRVPRQS